MAIGIHVATIVMKPILSNGTVIDKETATMREMMDASTEQRVKEDASIPNTSGYPSIKEYLELEAGDDYVANHVDQTFIITYNAGDVNGA